MPKTKISEFSATPANNTDIDSINIAEGCAPSGINDAIRELMAQLKDFQVGSAGDPVTVGGVLTVQAGSASTPSLTTAGDTNTGMFFPAADTIAFAEGGVEAMRLDASGNMGIGTSSPASDARLTLASPTTESYVMFSRTNSGVFDAAIGNNGGSIVFKGGADSSTVAGLTEFMRLDSTGNLGLGVTPSAWTSSIKAMQVGTTGALWATGGITFLTNNAYTDGTDKYLTTGVATRYYQSSGGHFWNIAPSGTAGNAITFTQAMTLDSGGNLLVGTTSGNNTIFKRNTDSASSAIRVISATATTSNQYGISCELNGDPNNSTNYFIANRGGVDGTTDRCIIRSNGGIANYSANNVNLSDRREKTNFAPAKSYLDVICSIPVQTYNYIDQNMEDDGGLTLGVVAQDVQSVAPELVMESNWGTEEEPKMRLSIYQTDLQYALMKALQELKAEFDAYKASHP
jgi:hypothetical protein